MNRVDVPVHCSGLARANIALRSISGGSDRPDVIYVHGATFGCECSVFFPLDGRSWADALLDAGFNVWGFDFIGYGASSRYPQSSASRGRMLEAATQLQAVVAEVRRRSGGRAVCLLAHSWGCTVAAQVAILDGAALSGVVLFAPVASRTGLPEAGPPPPSFFDWSVWAQYRRMIEGAPRGEAAVLSDRHFNPWAQRYLASDAGSGTREPPAVRVPGGPAVDVASWWSGQALLDPAAVVQPALVVRGEWDTVCDEADAQWWLSALGSDVKQSQTLMRGTHLMHLESGRESLYAACNRFLLESVT